MRATPRQPLVRAPFFFCTSLHTPVKPRTQLRATTVAFFDLQIARTRDCIAVRESGGESPLGRRFVGGSASGSPDRRHHGLHPRARGVVWHQRHTACPGRCSQVLHASSARVDRHRSCNRCNCVLSQNGYRVLSPETWLPSRESLCRNAPAAQVWMPTTGMLFGIILSIRGGPPWARRY